MNMQNIIEKYDIKHIWHFTDRSNLKSIDEHGGLLSLSKLNEMGIDIPVPGGNDWSQEADEYKEVDKYVHLCFLDNHPMLFIARKENRIQNPIWLQIDSSVMLGKNVRFTADVSNKSGVRLLKPKEAVAQIDFEILFTFTDWQGRPDIHDRRKAAEKSEILIPDMVPEKKILEYKNG